MRIAILTIATNKYIEFAKPLYESIEKHLLKDHKLDVFLFTNHLETSNEIQLLKNQFGSENRVSLLIQKQEHEPWPNMTLKRYEMFSRLLPFEGYDYLYYCDIDMLFVSEVGNEILSDLVGTMHPGFYDKPRSYFSYETRPESKVCIKANEGVFYYAGGFQGGKNGIWTKAIKEIKKNLDEDLKNGIMPVWFDESGWNHYLIKNPPTKSLSPSYCYPEELTLPFKKRLLALCKNHEEFRK